MHEHIGKRAKMQRSKESQTGGIKQARQASITTHGAEKGYTSNKLISRRCISQAVTSKQATRRTNATTQASGPKDRQVQAHGVHKVWQSLDLDRQTWI